MTSRPSGPRTSHVQFDGLALTLALCPQRIRQKTDSCAVVINMGEVCKQMCRGSLQVGGMAAMTQPPNVKDSQSSAVLRHLGRLPRPLGGGCRGGSNRGRGSDCSTKRVKNKNFLGSGITPSVDPSQMGKEILPSHTSPPRRIRRPIRPRSRSLDPPLANTVVV